VPALCLDCPVNLGWTVAAVAAATVIAILVNYLTRKEDGQHPRPVVALLVGIAVFVGIQAYALTQSDGPSHVDSTSSGSTNPSSTETQPSPEETQPSPEDSPWPSKTKTTKNTSSNKILAIEISISPQSRAGKDKAFASDCVGAGCSVWLAVSVSNDSGHLTSGCYFSYKVYSGRKHAIVARGRYAECDDFGFTYEAATPPGPYRVYVDAETDDGQTAHADYRFTAVTN
jgi:hypothetical protein